MPSQKTNTTNADAKLDAGTIEAIITNRILDYHEKLVEDFGIKKVSVDSAFGISTRCKPGCD